MINHFLIPLLAILCKCPLIEIELASAFVSSPHIKSWRGVDRQVLYSKRFNEELDETARRKGQGGMGETVAGAVLGGLLLGPFGALFGASIGSNVGARNSIDRAKKEEMDRLGFSQEMLDTAQEIGSSLQSSLEAIRAVQNSLETQHQFARRLDSDAKDLYQRANTALQSSDDSLAKKLMLERTELQEKLKQVLIQCAEEMGRLKTMQGNVAQLERRALECDSLLRRTASAKALGDMMDPSDFQFSPRREDPLLQKFRDMGID